ncbi:NAD-dependent epimerase/dehydratase family protein [Nocardioides convexus]|uniref:NAD-dependent epimerase/dehydratase family protein n=1 Tax=Nocardioides convexus TaxID=2712224 RepID=UPI002418766C|nr:NAD-dependent epimerase/dehydratase family protein [Nocardioides convexus]
MGAGRTVLVTGVSRDLGRTFARTLATDPGVDRVIGVDVIPPRGDLGDVTFVRADIRNPVIAKVIAKEDVDTVVHMSVIATPGSAGARGTMKESQRHRDDAGCSPPVRRPSRCARSW